MKIIDETEARALIEADADHLPQRVINDTGRAAVSAWLAKEAIGEQLLDAWLADAERAANDAAEAEYVIIELPAHHTHAGRPSTLMLGAECLDWVINE